MNKPENDAEAETALLTLGATLEWARARDFSSNIGGFETIVEHTETYLSVILDKGIYTIYLAQSSGGWGCIWSRFGSSRDDREFYQCETLTAAKAACELHRATGKWE